MKFAYLQISLINLIRCQDFVIVLFSHSRQLLLWKQKRFISAVVRQLCDKMREIDLFST